MKTKVVDGKVTAITVTFEGLELSVAEYVFLQKKFREFKLDYYIEGIVFGPICMTCCRKNHREVAGDDRCTD